MKEILFPVGRLVGGSLYQGQTKDDKGQPLVYKSGQNAGQPRTSYSFGVAYAKGNEQHWNQTAWGAQLWEEGKAGAPKLYESRHFAWKVTDGDSTEPNKKGNKPCDREGYPGHWVLWFSGTFAPKVFNADGTKALTDPDLVKPGHFVQVFGNVQYNKQTESPGVYINYTMVAHSGHGPLIELAGGPDASAVGFGQAPLPAGASATPLAGMDTAPAVDDAPPPPPVESHTGYMDPPAAVWPPEGWKQNPNGPGWWYNTTTKEQLKEADLRARVGA